MYSLVSSSVLAADLVRHPHGLRVADVIDRVLALSAEEQALLGAPAPREVRSRVLSCCEDIPQLGATQTVSPPAGPPGTPATERRGLLLTSLDGALLGSLPDVHGMLLREQPLHGLSGEAQQVALDGVTAAWAGSGASLRDLSALAEPWEAALAAVPPSLPEVGWARALRELLDLVPRRSMQAWSRSAAAHTGRRGLRWSEAMHTACVAALDAGRVVPVARAQLAAARALILTHTGVSPYAAAMVLSAAVQATCLSDLLEPEVTGTLLGAWEAGETRS